MMFRSALICVVALGLSACGGGGGTESAGSAPPPVVSEVARQTPINTSLANLTQAETFNTVASTVRVTVTGGSASSLAPSQAGMSSDVTIAYNPTNQSYTIATNRGGISNQTTFTAADLTVDPSGVADYSKTSPVGDEQQLLLASAGTLQYSALGTWTNISDSGNVRTLQAAFVAFGQETATSALPKTGSATYDLLVAGIGRDGSSAYGVGGDGTANVNFATASLSTIFNVGFFGANGPISSQTLNGTASIASNFARFSGTLQGTVNGTGVNGPMNGAFFGPTGQEIGGSWRVAGGQVEIAGGFVGVSGR